jgi:hypothetical protein
MRIVAHSSPVTYAGQKSAKTPYFVEKKCLTALGEGPVGRRRTTAENESEETDPFSKGSRCRSPLTPALSLGRGSQKQFIGRCCAVAGPTAPLSSLEKPLLVSP